MYTCTRTNAVNVFLSKKENYPVLVSELVGGRRQIIYSLEQ